MNKNKFISDLCSRSFQNLAPLPPLPYKNINHFFNIDEYKRVKENLTREIKMPIIYAESVRPIKKEKELDRISIPCEDAFNPEELADMVTREKPFMYTKGAAPTKHINETVKKVPSLNRPFHNKCVYVFVHESLMVKARSIGVAFPDKYKFKKASCGNYYCGPFANINGPVKELKNIFHDIRRAEWSDQQKLHIMITFEDI